jgi:flagellar FliL protein
MAEAPQETEVAQLKSSNKLLLILLLLAVAGASAGGAWYFTSKHDAGGEKHEEVEAEHEAEEAAPPVFVSLEAFTVNLQPDGQFLQATFSLQVSDEKEAEKLKLYTPQIRSRILLMLSSKTVETLSKQEGKTALIEEIKTLIEQPLATGLPPIKVGNVFVTSFIIQ